MGAVVRDSAYHMFHKFYLQLSQHSIINVTKNDFSSFSITVIPHSAACLQGPKILYTVIVFYTVDAAYIVYSCIQHPTLNTQTLSSDLQNYA